MAEQSEGDIAHVEPQITSNDPNERKLARKLRIERRWETIRRQGMTEAPTEVEEHNEILLQVQKSAELLEKFIHDGEEYVSNVRVANDAREVDRRDAEGINREKVIEQLENEAEAAQNMFQEIADKWTVIQNYNDPLHINEDIMNQKEKCDLVIKQKDEVIAMLKDELKKAEKKFTKDQRKQIEDINTLAHRIEKQITFMRCAYNKEFELIETVILGERQKLIDGNNRKWDELYKKRDQQELENSDKKFELLEEFETNMTDMRLTFHEKFRETKIKLENDIENLQKELERIKALALLNSEKLDYNYQILKKREDENIIIKSQQKRRINKLQDIINDLRRKIADYETSTNNGIKKLNEQIRKLHRNILEVEAKADHFAKINDEKFHQVWEMNRKRCEETLRKILDTDKILHEQQMGISWDPPPYNIASKIPSGHKDTKVDESSPHASVLSTGSTTKARKLEMVQYEMVKSQLTAEERDMNPIYKRLLRYLLTHISDKSGFLTETRLKAILRPYEDRQKTMIRLDNVFESLGIYKKEDIDLMINCFIPYTYCAQCSGQSDLAPQLSVISRFTSQLSTISSLFSRSDLDHLDIRELEQAFNAIQQPVEVIEQVVLDLISSEGFSEERQINEDDSLSQACGEVAQDDAYTDFKEKKVSGKKTFVAEERMLCQYNHPLVISSVFVLRALREFVISYYAEKEGLPTTRERLERRRLTVSRVLEEADIKSYWEKFRIIYNEDRVRVWDGLLEGLKKYHDILKDRKSLCEEVVSLRRQNQDLKRLLSNYMDHGETMNPPCAIEHEQCLNTTPPSYTNAKT